MKKKLLILMMCLFSAVSANAATWIAVDSGAPDIQMFIDNDSIKYIANDQCTYALLYKKTGEDVKIIYAKSDYSANKVGIIRVEDYEINKYKPMFYSKHARAFMKDIDENAILMSAHNYALSTHREKFEPDYAANMTASSNIYSSSVNFESETYKAYVEDVKAKILSNWNSSIDSVYTDVNVMLSLNMDGSLNGYRILESSAGDKGKRAAIAAILLSAPFNPFSDGAMLPSTRLNIPLKFEQKFFRKYVK